MNDIIRITKHANGVVITPIDNDRSTNEDALASILVTFKPLDDFDRKHKSDYHHPVHHILDALKPLLLEMDAQFVKENTPAAEPNNETTKEEN